MIIFPAIDLRNGSVVRLQYGDPARQTAYDPDPVAVARRFARAGAAWLHVVNLDGALEAGGEAAARNFALLEALAAVGPRVQFGGGLRGLAQMARALGAGATRVVLGTVAAEQPEVVRQAVERFGPERVAVGIDARSGRVKTRGWQAEGGVTAVELGRRVRALGVEVAIHTDIGRDGALAGVNAAASRALARAAGLRVIASGGVSSLADVRACAGLEGVIVGRALYEGKIKLEALFGAGKTDHSLP